MSAARTVLLCCLFVMAVLVRPAWAAERDGVSDGPLSGGEANGEWAEEDEFGDLIAPAPEALPDPFESVNRVFFVFNDRLYFWVLKPAARAYSHFLAEDVRGCVRNFFKNIATPVRLTNNLLQGKVKGGGIELLRFVINSTVGIAGFGDPARTEFDLRPSDEDCGQTLGYYGMGGGVYICWPLLGPSNLRDTAGLVGDALLNPLSYLAPADSTAGLAINGGERLNNISLTIGNYEKLKEASFDSYAAVRDAYLQHRHQEIVRNQ